MSGNRPELKIAIKPRDGGERVSLFAFWRGKNGKLSGQLDRRVTELAAKLEDGTVVRVKRGADGKSTHFVDAFEERATQRAEEPAADFGDDELPF
jgi:hypothetical protein